MTVRDTRPPRADSLIGASLTRSRSPRENTMVPSQIDSAMYLTMPKNIRGYVPRPKYTPMFSRTMIGRNARSAVSITPPGLR